MSELTIEKTRELNRESCRIKAKSILSERGFTYLKDEMQDAGKTCVYIGNKFDERNQQWHCRLSFDLETGEHIIDFDETVKYQ
ncbi:MAG: hypothetical protein Q7K39_02860 [Candidatus Magasanikbacteria bacterium]|nr:hypothetical protein [Candidatus Magasanikbacteria bacterium]